MWFDQQAERRVLARKAIAVGGTRGASQPYTAGLNRGRRQSGFIAPSRAASSQVSTPRSVLVQGSAAGGFLGEAMAGDEDVDGLIADVGG